jgi:hypothetical protein
VKKLFILLLSTVVLALGACSSTSTQLKAKEVKKSIEELDQEKGLVFDYRQYSEVKEVVDHLRQSYQGQLANFDEESWKKTYEEAKTSLNDLKKRLSDHHAVTYLQNSVEESIVLLETMNTELRNTDKKDLTDSFGEIESLVDKAKKQGTVTITTEITAEVEKVLNDNLNYAMDEDIDGYMSTLVRELQDAKQSTLEQFNNFDMEYSIESSKVLEAYENAVIIEVKQKTIFTETPEGMQVTDNVATATHTLIKEDGTYKFYSTEIIKSEPILN